MGLTGRKKRSLDRTVHVRDATLIVIATEGSETEPEYFRWFQSSRVKIEVLPSQDGRSAPDHVLENLRAYRDAHRLEPEDELWLVVDVDRWGDRALARLTREEWARCAVSNPCFELWLLYHHELPEPVLQTTRAVCERLKAVVPGYTKSSLDRACFWHGVDDALERGVSEDASPADRWPQTRGSHVYRLVRSIMNHDS